MRSKKHLKKTSGLTWEKVAAALEEGRILAEALHKEMEPMFRFTAVELRTPVY